MKLAEARKFAKEQEAEGIAAVGRAEAEAIRAKALAEAEGIDKKAEAQKKMETASILEMYFNALPAVVSGAAAPLANVDKITMYGDGNQTKMMADVMKSTDQIMNALAESTGIDVKSVLTGFVGGKAAK
jgi:flotillin